MRWLIFSEKLNMDMDRLVIWCSVLHSTHKHLIYLAKLLLILSKCTRADLKTNFFPLINVQLWARRWRRLAVSRRRPLWTFPPPPGSRKPKPGLKDELRQREAGQRREESRQSELFRAWASRRWRDWERGHGKQGHWKRGQRLNPRLQRWTSVKWQKGMLALEGNTVTSSHVSCQMCDSCCLFLFLSLQWS